MRPLEEQMISRVEGTRQSDRVSLRLHVNASWFANDGTAVKQAAETLLVSRNGGVLRLTEKLFAGQEITLHRELEGDQSKSARARMKLTRKGEVLEALVVVRIVKPRVGMGVEFFDLESSNSERLVAWMDALRHSR